MTKFDRHDGWEAMEAEDRAYWAERSITERALSVLSLSRELMAVQQQNVSASAKVADELHLAAKLRGWIALKEGLRCPSTSPQNSKKSLAGR